MGMGYGANFAEVIEEKSVEKFCKKELAALNVALDKDDQDFGSFAQAAHATDFDHFQIGKKAIKAYEVLQYAFTKKTGLLLSLGYHDADNEGDRYDDVNGAFWCVHGMYQLSKAGKKMQKFVDRKFYVIYG
jgi:hypothetical protein